MSYIANDILWWKVSLLGFFNGWLPGVLTFLLGLVISKISSHRNLRNNLKNSILSIFIPTFNAGREISEAQVQQTIKELRLTINTYRQIYPKIFNEHAARRLEDIFSKGPFEQSGDISEEFKDTQLIINIIKEL
ncbi:hypothetical protein [Pseudomonas sp. 5P_3.1_Bac2]|uniref:hypothetical protein n=1 Tax=Pseudomonas sp. 5P_3.1_Bac2 TaxID=2971617 RepID=UPI0021C9A9A9|nr:hypothetical protein [Pseudomonas sp. 5P_3.1_Bac2]MCU1716437.1 hypothetical protein [Pseudomonas sp. 5P_3.1_Bac2]